MADNKTMADALLSAAEVARALNLGRENCVSVSVDSFAEIIVHLEPEGMSGIERLTGGNVSRSGSCLTLYHNGVRYIAVDDDGEEKSTDAEEDT